MVPNVVVNSLSQIVASWYPLTISAPQIIVVIVVAEHPLASVTVKLYESPVKPVIVNPVCPYGTLSDQSKVYGAVP